MDELTIFIKCKLTVANMHALINKKFKTKVRYQDVYNMVKQIKKVNFEGLTIKEY